MQKILFALVLALTPPTVAQAQIQTPDTGSGQSKMAQLKTARWNTAQAGNLLNWMLRAPEEAIFLPEAMVANLDAAIDSGEGETLDRAANLAAARLISAYHGACCGTALPANWHISRELSASDLEARIDRALTLDQLDLLLRAERVSHPHYRAIAAAYSAETDEVRRQLLALNLARWRTLAVPRQGRYLIVNIAAQELTLWDGDELVETWRVIVGKKATKTPVFQAEVSGVVLNPWWNIPASIAAEGIGAFVRRNRSAARASGDVYSNGRYRQMPGENNALGRMKLVMPNRFTVFLHDTSNRDLFQLDDRLRSHGCIRVDRALQFAGALLQDGGWTAEMVDQVVASNETRTVSLSQPVPLFVAYFTVEPDENGPGENGRVRELADIYGRDQHAVRAHAEPLGLFPYPLSALTDLSNCSGKPNSR